MIKFPTKISIVLWLLIIWLITSGIIVYRLSTVGAYASLCATKTLDFIKETGRILDVDEQLLISEANRILRTKVSAEARTELQQTEETNFTEELKGIIDVQHHDHQEKDIIRVLLNFADKPYEGYKNVAHFVLHEIAEDEIEIENPTVLAIIHYYQEELEHETINTTGLINHANPNISKMAADILSVNIDISPQWEAKYSILIETVGSNYVYDIQSALARLKLKNIEKLIQHNQLELNKTTNDADIEAVLKVHQHLMELRTALTHKWGTVILK